MECKRFKNNILNYHYLESDGNTQAEMQEHMTQCSDCFALYFKISRVLDSTKILKEMQPNPFFYTRLSVKLNNQKPQKIYIRLFTRIAQPLFAISLAIFGVFIGFKISDGLQNTIAISPKSNISQIAVSQLADEYYLKTTDEEVIETYYLLNDK